MPPSRLAFAPALLAGAFVLACSADNTGPGALPGDPDAPAAEAVPMLAFEPGPDDDPTNTVIVSLALGTTVGEANAMIDRIDAEIVGGHTGVAEQAEGVLVLHTPTDTEAEMDSLVEDLGDDPIVAAVAADAPMVGNVVPSQPDDIDRLDDWDWTCQPAGQNYGLELVRAPAMWNFNDIVLGGSPDSHTMIAIVDEGFEDHPDLSFGWTGSEDDHGTHVAGTIGATWGNEFGVDGVTPFHEMVPYEAGSWASIITGEFPEAIGRGAEVINVSMGYSAAAKAQPNHRNRALAHAATLVSVLTSVSARGNGTLPVFVTSAGNDANHARYNDPLATAAIELGIANVLVIESVGLDPSAVGGVSRATTSNFGGHLSAPGVDIVSTAQGRYELKSGTSMATPHVTGVVGYVYTVAPDFPRATLFTNPVGELLLANAVPVDGSSAPLIDGFATTMDIDRILQSDRMMNGLCDIDDGTEDGNTRVDVVTGAVNEEPDADNDSTGGDGIVDMSDFRRFRDWRLQARGEGNMDGAADHPKRDLDFDGLVENPADECWVRGDFNGDAKIHDVDERYVPGFVSAMGTDLDVFMHAYAGTDVPRADLPRLLESGDIHLELGTCFERSDIAWIDVTLPGEGTVEFGPQQAENLHILTKPVAAYDMRVEAFHADGSSASEETFAVDVTLGGDVYVRPSCGNAPSGWLLTPLDTANPIEINDAGEVLSEPSHRDYRLTRADGTTVDANVGGDKSGYPHYLTEGGVFAYPDIILTEPGVIHETIQWDAISRNGVFAGSYSQTNRTRGYVYFGAPEDGEPDDILLPFTDEGNFTIGFSTTFIPRDHAVNDAGTVVGAAGEAFENANRPAILSGDEPEWLPLPSGFDTGFAAFISGGGTIAGYAGSTPVLWAGGGVQVLPDDGLEPYGLQLLSDSDTLIARQPCTGCYAILPAGAEAFTDMPRMFTDADGIEYPLQSIVDMNANGVILATALAPDSESPIAVLLAPR